MNNRWKIPALVALCSGVVLVSGCGKEEQPPMPPPAAEKTEDKAATEAPKTAEAPAPAPSAPAVTPPSAPTATAPAADRFQSLVDTAKSLIDSQNYTEATKIIAELKSLQLTPEQQKVVDDLKAQVDALISKATSTEAGKAVGNLLGN